MTKPIKHSKTAFTNNIDNNNGIQQQRQHKTTAYCNGNNNSIRQQHQNKIKPSTTTATNQQQALHCEAWWMPARNQTCVDSFNNGQINYIGPATWLLGLFSHLEYFKIIPNENRNVFNYQLFYNSITKSPKTKVTDLFRSEAYCRMERLQSNLDSIICGCSSEGGPQCFTASTPFLVTKPCAGLSIIYSISQISIEICKSAQKESLASNFLSYEKEDKHGVLLGDGIMIKSQEVQIDDESTPAPIQSKSNSSRVQ
ncbi:hypothetical protein ACTA71_005467 [Dictyostelium dimigraforme]